MAIKDFQDAFQKWQKRWDRCVRSQGDYFEGDGANKIQVRRNSLY
jgi:hypothetical protein